MGDSAGSSVAELRYPEERIPKLLVSHVKNARVCKPALLVGNVARVGLDKSLADELLSQSTRSQDNSKPHKIIQPILINNNHWVLLFFYYVPGENAPLIYYFDSLDHKPNEKVTQVIHSVMREQYAASMELSKKLFRYNKTPQHPIQVNREKLQFDNESQREALEHLYGQLPPQRLGADGNLTDSYMEKFTAVSVVAAQLEIKPWSCGAFVVEVAKLLADMDNPDNEFELSFLKGDLIKAYVAKHNLTLAEAETSVSQGSSEDGDSSGPPSPATLSTDDDCEPVSVGSTSESATSLPVPPPVEMLDTAPAVATASATTTTIEAVSAEYRIRYANIRARELGETPASGSSAINTRATTESSSSTVAAVTPTTGSESSLPPPPSPDKNQNREYRTKRRSIDANIRKLGSTITGHTEVDEALKAFIEEVSRIYQNSQDDNTLSALETALAKTVEVVILSPKNVTKINEYCELAKNFEGSRSPELITLGAFMLVVGAGLVAVGGLILASVLTISTAGLAPALIGTGAALMLFSGAGFGLGSRHGLADQGVQLANALEKQAKPR